MQNVRSRRIRRGFEQLENRRMNAVTAEMVFPRTLVITGDEAADTVSIQHSDYAPGDTSRSTDTVILRANGQPAQRFDGVGRIEVELNAGDDSFEYRSGPNYNDRLSYKDVSISLGDGNDQCNLNFGYRDGFFGLYDTSISVNAGAGDDTLIGEFGADTIWDLAVTARMGSGQDHVILDLTSSRPDFVEFDLYGEEGDDVLDVVSWATLDLYMNGGAGNDRLNFDFAGTLRNHPLKLRMHGEAGNDQLNAEITCYRGKGAIDAELWGDAGDDRFDFRLYNPERTARIRSALTIGGAGQDQSRHTPNVSAVEVHPLFTFPGGAVVTGGKLARPQAVAFT